MNTGLGIVLGIAAIPIAIYLLQGIVDCFQIRDTDQFFLAGRKLGTWSFALNAAATNFSFLTAVFVLVTWSYNYGPIVWWAVISAVVGFALYAIPAISPIKDKAFFATGDTLHHYLGIRYGSRLVRFVAAVATITAFLGFFVAALYIFAGFLTQYVAVDLWILILILAAIIGLYTILGGFQSVVKTDIWQTVFIGLGIVCLLVILSGAIDLLGAVRSSFYLPGLIKPTPLFSSPPGLFLFVLMLFIINGLWQFSAMDMWQRSLAAKEQRKIALASQWGAGIFAIIAASVVVGGVGIRLAFPTSQLMPFEIIGKFIENQNPWLVGGLFAMFVSALLSTADSNLIALSQSVLYDVLGVFSKAKAKATVAKSRILIFVIILVGISFLYLYTRFSGPAGSENLITLLITFFSCQIVLFPSIIYAVFHPCDTLPSWPAFLSISFGYVCAMVLGVASLIKPELQSVTPVISLAAAIFVLSVTLPAFSKVNEERSSE